MMRVYSLTPRQAERWLDIGPPAAAPASLVDAIRALLASGELNPSLLVVAERGGRVLARCEALLSGSGCVTVMPATFREGLRPGEQASAADAILQHLVATARLEPQARYIETETHAESHSGPVWQSVLARAGLEPIATYSLYERVLTSAPPCHLDAAMDWQDFDSLSAAAAEHLLGSIHRESADRLHQGSPETTAWRLHRLRHQPRLSPDRRGWLVAMRHGSPIGLVLCGCEDVAYGDASVGWILEIGVLPERRGSGLGKALLTLATHALWRLGARRIRARIDDMNAPSRALHLQAGFSRLSDPSQVWWYPLRPGDRT